jgi:tetratricopeptide (TPR) repeat protein
MTLLLPYGARLGVLGAAFVLALAVFAVLSRSQPPGAPSPRALGATTSSGPTDRRIALLQAALAGDADARGAHTALGAAYLQKAREAGDPGWYARAEAAFTAALRRDGRDAGAVTGLGALALARHDFRTALVHGRRARRLAPRMVRPYGVVADAQLELGRYDAAARTLQRMVDLKPNLDAYARVSYFRQLHGDLPGAVGAMRLAVAAGGEAPENAAYAQTLLGDLEWERGRAGAARMAYRAALARLPGHAPAHVGLARLDGGRARLDAAARRLRTVTDRLPVPAYVTALGEVELARGRPAAARRQFALVRAQYELLGATGVATDVEAALFEADHGRPARALALARRAWRAAPSVRSADAMGWALTRAGRPRRGLRFARRALALGTRDPVFHYHAGVAARAAGRPAMARRELRAALRPGPDFSPLYAPRARRVLRGLA